MRISEEKKEIAKAYNILQKQMRPASKDSVNPHFRSKYSSYESTWEALRDPLTDNGLSCEQDVTTGEKSVSVLTFVLHISGEWMEFGPLTMPVNKLDCQGFASAISYAKRYALQAAFGIVSGEDDDGNAAAQQARPQTVTNQAIDKNEEPKITADQAIEIKKLLSKLSVAESNGILGSFRVPPINANTIEQIPASKFGGILEYIKKQVEKQESTKNE